ncbi:MULTISPECIES: Y4bD/Y4pK family protein [unclassified Bradyrhizobium]|uniref:Y4bD/Y4pK family protein n=1 Tax=unclassified Bradyrhizobium TaxID=2631580 RepID=UPI0020B1CC8A|nr:MULTISPECIES: Y4bD/Y4pK family protein [unclassified Bradyrhizobium]MCP3380109.1 Y4bD/Y4pK family protein [Bradyrhizobium sp. CCGUVB4N]MCP3440956.1 Y4bD/Y4pK family protein [Bradyrhizobium sp. CCGUVB14]
MSHVTITDPHHFLFGQRLEVLKERSGRGPAYVIVVLPDGRRRGVRIASTDLAETSSRPNAADLPRISVRTLIPLMQYLSASLGLLDEKVIRDDPPTASRSRCVSTAANIGKSTRPSDGRHSAPLAESVDRDANPDCSSDRRADAANASDPRHTRKGTGSC